MSVRLALVACLDERRSVHTVTFKRAIDAFIRLCEQQRNHSCELRIELFNDDADAGTAGQVATEIIKWGPHAVIGHFASGAAAAAAPIYEAANIPLLLPAATARHLTQSATTYRICDHDETYVQAIHRFCRRHNLRLDDIRHDGTVHGKSVATAISNSPQISDQGRSCIMFSGSFRNSIKFMAECKGSKGKALLLTDDALAPEIVAPVQAYGGEVFIIGLVPRPRGQEAEQLLTAYQATFRSDPGSYFWETIAAMQVAVAARGGDLQQQTWNTVLGALRFDEERECSPSNSSAYRVLPSGGFEECDL